MSSDEELFQGLHVVGHVPLARRHHRGTLAQDVVPGEEDLLLALVKTAMPGLMPRGEHHFELAAVVGDAVSLNVGEVLAAEMPRAHPRDADLGARPLLERQRAAAVVHVDVGEQDPGNAGAAQRLHLGQQPVDVGIRAEGDVDDRDLPAAE